MPLGTHCYFEGCYNHPIDQGQTSSGPPSDVDLKNRCPDNNKDPKSVHMKVDPNPWKIVHSTSAHDGMGHLYEWTHSRDHTKSEIQSNLDIDVMWILVGNLSMMFLMAEIHVRGAPLECYVVELDTHWKSYFESVDSYLIRTSHPFTFIHTFPAVLDCFGIWSVGLSLPSFSTTSGDHACFFKGEALGDGIDNASLTGACLTLFPHWVFIVVTSKMSGFGLGGEGQCLADTSPYSF